MREKWCKPRHYSGIAAFKPLSPGLTKIWVKIKGCETATQCLSPRWACKNDTYFTGKIKLKQLPITFFFFDNLLRYTVIGGNS